MNTNGQWIPRAILWAGVIEVLVGAMHFLMPPFVFRSAGFVSLSASEADFVRLILFALGFLLVALGSLTVVVSLHQEEWHGLLLPLLTIQSLLWCARIGIEVHYPVAVPLFFLDQPTTLVMPLLVFETLLFVLPLGFTCWLSRTQPSQA